MRSILSAGAAVLALVSVMGAAQAADIIEEPPVFVEPPPVYVESGGFYIRGDVGYAFKSKTSGDYKFWNWGHDGKQNHDGSYNYGSGEIDRGVDGIFHYDEIKLRGAGTFGLGAGYRFNDTLRADVTVDYMKHDVKGTTDCAYPVEIGYNLSPVKGGCKFNDDADAKIWTTMANVYADIGRFGVVRPYVGAGAGFAHVKYGDMRNEISCGDQPGCFGRETYVGYHKGESSWRFAASLMAGASVDITDNLIFDAGYRYTRIEDGDAFGYDSEDMKYGASGVQGRDHGFDIHTVRAGLRYEFGGGGLGFGKGKGPVEQAAFEPAAFEPAPFEPAPVYK
ncbi:outer membrane protein [Antarcticirhabdus aurantiaca]|uniref:Outer membrane beta-barrel protein n=1 Tax=Antarcticirhabdus aurantiaca TaxID=2606717 RepID=A0ACD4NJX0_9HYPH|nr:outer membrane beta-barrel protein [Antarcticirhabdus aurantiaca]WAJ27064.1 outer membrane beta-barrel protein [Jeongeuplla avenae]